jgi:hypothetical protein
LTRRPGLWYFSTVAKNSRDNKKVTGNIKLREGRTPLKGKAKKELEKIAKIRAEILQHLRNGNFRIISARLARLAPSTLDDWIKFDPSYAEEVFHAEAEGENEQLQRVKRGEMGWQSGAWYLERKYKARWAAQAQGERSTLDFTFKPHYDDESNTDTTATDPASPTDATG